METKHAEKIVKTYHKLLNFNKDQKEMDKAILDTILDAYTFAYDNGVLDEKNKMLSGIHNRLDVDKEKLLKKCRGEIPVNIEEIEIDEFFSDMFEKTKNIREQGKSLLGERKITNDTDSNDLEA